MDLNNDIYNKIINEQPILFLGAGASINSGAPIVSQLYSMIWDKLNLEPEDKKIIENNTFSFEFFVSMLLSNCSMENFFKMFEPFDKADIHIILDYLVSKGLIKNIITTNFDTLIEDNITSKTVHTYIGDEILNADLNNEDVNVLKVHGCIKDISSLKITLNKVANRQNKYLIEALFSKIVNEVNHPKIMFIGYSFSDHFDIVPALNKYLNGIQVLNIHHTSKSNYSGKVSLKNVTLDFTHPNVQFIATNTDELISYLTSKFTLKNQEFIPKIWKNLFQNWIDEPLNRNLIPFYNVTGALMMYLGYMEQSASLYQKAIVIANEIDDKLWGISLNISLSGTLLLLEKFNSVEEIMNKNLDHFDTVECNVELIAETYCNLSMSKYHLGKYSEALLYCYKAMNICAEGQADQLYYKNYCNLGLILNKINCGFMAKTYIETSIQHAYDSGDLASCSRRLAYLVEMQIDDGLIEIAEKNLEKAIYLSKLTGERSRVKLFNILDKRIKNSRQSR